VKNAFTLVEILVALAIVGLLSTACLAVLTRLNRAGAEAETLPSRTARLKSALVRAMADDLLHAGRFRAVEGGFEIQTTHWLSHDDLTRRHQPTAVRYTAIAAGGRSVLVRRQESADKTCTELVAAGVAGVAVELPPETSQEETPQIAAPGGWLPLPAIAKIVVQLDGREHGDERNGDDAGGDEPNAIVLELPTSK